MYSQEEEVLIMESGNKMATTYSLYIMTCTHSLHYYIIIIVENQNFYDGLSRFLL